MSNTREIFKGMVRQILSEELKKRDGIAERVPQMDGNGVDRTKEKNKTFSNLENPRDRKTKDQILSDLNDLVKDIDKNYQVVWDDHDDLKIDARDLMSMIITPDWEDHYEIVVMTRNEDRVYVTGLDWNQVKDFVKKNLGNADKGVTATDKAYDKSYRNGKDQIPSPDKGLPQKDKPKIKPLTNEKSKEKVEDQNKEVDNPDQPMKEVGDIKFQRDHKAQRPEKRLKGKQVTNFRDTQR